MSDAWHTLAAQGLDPERVRRLLAAHGGPARVLGRLGLAPDPGIAERLRASGVRFVTRSDPGFPPQLAELPDAPHWMYVRGAMADDPMVAIVGSRRASSYGLRLAGDLGRTVARSGWPVVSGLALGVDAAAHRGVVEAGGRAVAVLGSGVDVWYPRSNAGLGEAILGGEGAVVSEFPPGTTAQGWRFPHRNRIISGLSRVVIVVEAAVRSGALITARLALEQGREVFAVPGDVGRETSMGTNLLIRDGAHPLTDVESVVEMLELVVGPAPSPLGHAVEVAGVRLDSSMLIEEVVVRSELPATEVLAALAALEMRGLVRTAEGWVGPV